MSTIHTEQALQLVRSLAIEKLITDSHRRQMLESGILEKAHITMGSTQFILLLVDILDYQPGKLQLEMASSTDRDAALHDMVDQHFVSHFSKHFYAYSFLSGGQSYVLLNLQKQVQDASRVWQEEFMRDIYKECSVCVRQIISRYGITARVYISDFIPTMDDLGARKDWLGAMISNDYQGEEDSLTFTTADMDQALMASNAITAQIQGLTCKIMELAQKHKFAEAYQVVVSLLNLETQYYGASAGLRSRLSGLITVLYASIGIPYYLEQCEELQIHKVLLGIKNAMDSTELLDDIRQLFGNIESYFTESTKTTQERMEDIAEYINRNYFDPMLSVASISDHYGINPSYLSRLFKEKRGEKLIDCIHKTRLRYAKQLLAQTGETIDYIAAAVGYQNSQTFARAFKRYEGVTPGAFRMVPVGFGDMG